MEEDRPFSELVERQVIDGRKYLDDSGALSVVMTTVHEWFPGWDPHAEAARYAEVAARSGLFVEYMGRIDAKTRKPVYIFILSRNQELSRGEIETVLGDTVL